MELTRSNYKIAIPKDIITLAGKCKVRECDEVEKDTFQAYVDEKKDSFDVLIRLNKELIQEHTCDCESKRDFCQHKTALLLFLVKEDKEKKPKKKADPLDALLAEVDGEKLKSWVKLVLDKNKDLSISFMQYFSPEAIRYTPEDVKKITQDAVKAILNTRKKADASEMKKLTTLWQQVYEPILNQVYQNLPDLANFLNFHAIITAVEDVQQKIKTTGNRVGKYVETLLSGMCDELVKIDSDQDWLTVTGYIADRIMETQFSIRMSYVSFQTDHFSKLPPNRRAMLIEKLMEYYSAIVSNRIYDGEKFTRVMFDMVVAIDMFNKYHKLFKPIRFNNEYNFELITLLITTGYLSLAESYCIDQIKGNFREEFNGMYQEFLREIYTIQENDQKLAGVLGDLFPSSYSMKDYQFILANLPTDTEKKNWRNKMLARARQAASQNLAAELFCFQLMELESDHKKMIGYIQDTTPYALIVPFAEKMILADKQGFLKALINKQDTFYQPEEPLLPDSLAALDDTIHSVYTPDEVAHFINAKTPWSYRPNLLVQYISANKRK